MMKKRKDLGVSVAGLAKKEKNVDQLKADMELARVAVVADYRGLTVAELTQLRRAFYAVQAEFTVTKNTLLRRAIKGSKAEVLDSLLKGPTAVLVGREDQVAPVKILKEFLKANKKDNQIRGGYLDGQFLSAAAVEELADLPPLDELRAKLLGGIASPLTGLVASISGPQRALVNVLDQLAKQKQG